MQGSAADDLVVIAAPSDGAVAQWDGGAGPTGVMLRWFLQPQLGLPDLGFDVRRSPPLAAAQWLMFPEFVLGQANGQTQWSYGDTMLLACAAGLRFIGVPGSTSLFAVSVRPGDGAVSFAFAKTCTAALIVAGPGENDLSITCAIALADDDAVMAPQALNLRGGNRPMVVVPRPIAGFTVRGQGSILALAVVLADPPRSWPRIAHRCLPVFDPGYACARPGSATEADEAKSRLPAAAAADWPTRFAPGFAALSPVLRRLALAGAAQPIPRDAAHPDALLAANERSLLDLYALDPHGARILGLAYDDPVALDGTTYTYSVTARWRGPLVTVDGGDIDAVTLLRDHGVVLSLLVGDGGRGLLLTFPAAVHQLSVAVAVPDGGCSIETVDADGVSVWRSADPGAATVQAAEAVRAYFSWSDPREDLVLTRLQWTSVLERSGLVAVTAAPRAAPPGPATLRAEALAGESPSGPLAVALDWPVLQRDGLLSDQVPVCYQLGRRQLHADPLSPAPVPPAAGEADLLYDGAPLYLPTAAPPAGPTGLLPRHVDRNRGAGLAPGWWAWWVRGVDLFGCVSAPSAWGLAAVVDQRPPLPPLMLGAEWVQRDLPAASLATTGRSAMARRWLGASSAGGTMAGLVVCWTCGPDQLAGAGDVDGFQLLLRTPAGTPPAYGAWLAPIARFGPLPAVVRATVDALPRGASTDVLAVQLTTVEPMPATAGATTTDTRLRCRTDLDLDGASGLFVGGTLEWQGQRYAIVGNGDGPELAIVLRLPAAAPTPTPGAATLRLPAQRTLVEIAVPPGTPLPVAAGTIAARSGLLVVQAGAGEQRLAVLGRDGPRLLCLGAAASVAPGDRLAWYPVWFAALDDAGFGPRAGGTLPVAPAQVAVQAVRRFAGAALASATSGALTVTAVDAAVPPVPAAGAIAFDPQARCVQAATRADWYGHSRFTLRWTALPGCGVRVQRALGGEIGRLDRLAHAGRPHAFGDPAAWPPGAHADPGRRARVLAELAAIDQAATAGDAQALDAAYDALCIDTQRLLARQPYAAPAFATLTPAPLDGASFDDQLDGRSRAHWFYRLVARSATGVDSAPSEPTPPICCPDVVAPSAPQVRMALAGDAAVTLRWSASPEPDVTHYELHAAREPGAAADLPSRAPLESWTPPAHAGAALLERTLRCDPGPWCFWIVAVDAAGLRSAPSAMLQGRSLRRPPAPPVWVAAQRDATTQPARIVLQWRHDGDPRLACQLERRSARTDFWVVAAAWLPRGVYVFTDTPPDPFARWEYRLQVRDVLGQVAGERPTIAVEPA